MLKIGILGAGFMSGTHVNCYKALEHLGIRVTAVADIRADKAQERAAVFGSDIYPDGMALIERADVDVIDICLPTFLHTEHAVAAMKRGRAVFIEKPLCLTQEESERLLAAERETGVPAMVGQCIRFWDEYVWLHEAVESGRYGALVSASFRRLSAFPTWGWNGWLDRPEMSGSLALDMHVHDVDFIRWLLGEPDSVAAVCARSAEGVIEQIFSQYLFGGVPVTAEACWDFPASFPFSMSYLAKFERATAVFGSDRAPSLTVYHADGSSEQPEFAALEGSAAEGGNISSLGAYYNELRYFVETLLAGQPLTRATIADAAASAALCRREIALSGGALVRDPLFG